jgi:hypothetical protein
MKVNSGAQAPLLSNYQVNVYSLGMMIHRMI